ncbi:MAG: DUF4416 family protein [Desulfobacterales bacterium]|nr:DUF4416 family protein [Desulfobacterales bacterium]
MSRPQPPKPAKLVVGLFMQDRQLLKPVVQNLCEQHGLIDIVSPWLAFDFTTYYAKEMGAPLFRRMLAFKNLIAQTDLADIKLHTNNVENKFARQSNRQVNIDPGYMLLERFVLASGKNFTHRIYIGQQIYADLTLIFQKGAFQSLPWTYPDYADESMLVFLGRVRRKYIEDLRQVA